MRCKPRLRTVLLSINIVILLLPLAGIGALRLYESELVRRTESELISQGTLIGAAFREEVLRVAPAHATGSYGRPVTAPDISRDAPAQKFHPIIPRLDMAGETVRPPAPSPLTPLTTSDAVAREAGRRIAPILASSKDITLVGIRVVDCNGTVVATTAGDMGLSLRNREETHRALTGEYASLLRQRISDNAEPSAASVSRGKRLRVFVGMPVLHQGRVLGAVILSRTPLDIRKALYQVRGQIMMAGGALLGVVLTITLLTSVTVNRPLRALVREADRIVRGGKAGPLQPEGSAIREIGQLSEAVSTMARTLEERSEYIRTFASNVSHEFKTPLTSIRGTVELLEDHFADMSPEERSRFLGIISSDTERLERLVRRLLDLARADTITPGEERTDAAEVLEAVAKRYQDSGSSVSLSCQGSAGLKMNREVFESIVSNLIENARQHGGAGVQVTLCSRVTRDAERCLLEVDIQDDGPGISPANREKIFRPFFTTARDRGGSGLGLSIVQSLLAAHEGTISAVPAEKGALFRVRVPV